MKALTGEQKAQSRNDLAEIQKALLFAKSCGLISKQAVPAVDAALRLVENLSIACGIFTDGE